MLLEQQSQEVVQPWPLLMVLVGCGAKSATQHGPVGGSGVGGMTTASGGSAGPGSSQQQQDDRHHHF